ncbi:MAG: hypothetical protein Q9171_002974 [Xanthocarpia ochracea]
MTSFGQQGRGSNQPIDVKKEHPAGHRAASNGRWSDNRALRKSLLASHQGFPGSEGRHRYSNPRPQQHQHLRRETQVQRPRQAGLADRLRDLRRSRRAVPTKPRARQRPLPSLPATQTPSHLHTTATREGDAGGQRYHRASATAAQIGSARADRLVGDKIWGYQEFYDDTDYKETNWIKQQTTIAGSEMVRDCLATRGYGSSGEVRVELVHFKGSEESAGGGDSNGEEADANFIGTADGVGRWIETFADSRGVVMEPAIAAGIRQGRRFQQQ